MLKNNQKEIILLEDLGILYLSNTSKHKARFGLYKCYCGKEFKTQTQYIKSGHTQSCGCLQKQITANKNILNATHKQTKHRLYNIWNMMIQRCNNPKHEAYKNYGQRGIIVCDEWNDVENFIRDMNDDFIEGLTLDRENNSLGYNKSNCRWVNRNIQSRNTRKLISTNTSGYRGVSLDKKCNKWRTSIGINNKSIYIGLFNTALESALAYDKYVIDNNLEHTRNFK